MGWAHGCSPSYDLLAIPAGEDKDEQPMDVGNWDDRDLPVLKAAVELCDVDPFSQARDADIESRTGFDREKVQAALRALREETPALLQFEDGAGRIMSVRFPTGKARRRVGLWPVMPDVLIQTLVELAEREPDEEKKVAPSQGG
jgi:hypothetical protein